MVNLIIRTNTIFHPITNTVHWLRAPRTCALLVRVGIWASKAVVGRVGGNGIGPAPLVLVVAGVVIASAIRTPVTNTVHGLGALLSGAIHLACGVGALLSIQVSLDGHLIRSAALILVARYHMHASTKDRPFALAVHGLAATTLGALLQVVLVWASKTIVHGNLAHTVHAAALILVVVVVIRASIVVAPRANAVHRLRTTRPCAQRMPSCVRATVTIVLSFRYDLVMFASFISMSCFVVFAGAITIPLTNAIQGLGTSLIST